MKKYKYYERAINYYETDKMAVVHHSNYARYLEECRIDLLRFYGIPLEMFEELGYMIPVLELNCKFKESIKYGDVIRIVPCLEKVTPIRFHFTYKIYNQDMSRVVHEASTSHCFLDADFKPVSMKKEKPELYDKFLRISQELKQEDK